MIDLGRAPIELMNKWECARWIADLRYGPYKQGKERLVTVPWVSAEEHEYSYCCLGVYSFKTFPETAEKFNLRTNQPFMCKDLESEKDALINPAYKLPRFVQIHLAELNDGHLPASSRPLSFAEIADFIEKNLLPLLPDAK